MERDGTKGGWEGRIGREYGKRKEKRGEKESGGEKVQAGKSRNGRSGGRTEYTQNTKQTNY